VKPNRRISLLRFILAAALLLSTAVFLRARSGAENVPAHKPLAEMPLLLGDWVGRDVPMSADVLAVLGPGDFLTRLYSQQDRRIPGVDLYIAYFPTQRSGDTIHSPKNCLPGAGWAPLSSNKISIPRSDGPPIESNRYVLAMGDQRMLVLYWYQAHGRAVASEYSAKFYLVADAMRMNRTDGALVRVLTPVATGRETIEDAERRAIGFAKLIIPSLDDYVPR
jgi:EpsI family protein